MEDGDCTKEKSDCRADNFVDFKLDDLGCGVIKCPAAVQLKILITVYLNILVGHLNALGNWATEGFDDGIKDTDVCGYKDTDDSGIELVVFVELKRSGNGAVEDLDVGRTTYLGSGGSEGY